MRICKSMPRFLEHDDHSECGAETNTTYDYQYGIGSIIRVDVPICNECLKSVDIESHRLWRVNERGIK